MNSVIYGKASFRMITSLEVENFRGLGKIALENLPTVNVLVGPNGSGKTALLEAILIGCRASPQWAANTWQLRSQIALVPGGPVGFQAVWGGYFPNLDMTKTISIKYVDSNQGQRSLAIHHSRPPPMPQITFAPGQFLSPPPYSSPNGEISALVFERTSPELTTKAYAYVNQQGQLTADAAEPLGPSVAMFAALTPSNETDNTTWLSQLTIENEEKDVVSLLKQEFPQIESVSVINIGGFAGIYVGYKNGRSKFPIGSVSSGIHKVLTLILASLKYEKGVILIDEFENGIFYRRYEDLWRLIYRLAKTHNNQVFVSSHSLECLNAILPVVSENPEDFSLLRMESSPDGAIVKRFNGVEFASALAQDIDPRGKEQ